MYRDCNECPDMYPKEPYDGRLHTRHVCGKTGYICYHDKDKEQDERVIDVPLWCPLYSSSPFNELKKLKKQVEELTVKIKQFEEK